MEMGAIKRVVVGLIAVHGRPAVLERLGVSESYLKMLLSDNRRWTMVMATAISEMQGYEPETQ